MLWQRILSALIGGSIVIGLILWNEISASLLILLAFGLALWEYHRLAESLGGRVPFGLLLAWLLLFLLGRYFPEARLLEPGMALLLLASVSWFIWRYRQGDTASAFQGFALTIAGAFYVGWSGAHFVAIRLLPGGAGWMLITILSVWVMDAFAYIVGTAIGRTRLAPQISPGKTWEGYIGGLLVGTASAWGMGLAWLAIEPAAPILPWQGLLLGFILSALTPLGDIAISMLKRQAGAKDSGDLIPGHGGFLDRVDTIIWAGLLAYYLVLLLFRA